MQVEKKEREPENRKPLTAIERDILRVRNEMLKHPKVKVEGLIEKATCMPLLNTPKNESMKSTRRQLSFQSSIAIDLTENTARACNEENVEPIPKKAKTVQQRLYESEKDQLDKALSLGQETLNAVQVVSGKLDECIRLKEGQIKQNEEIIALLGAISSKSK